MNEDLWFETILAIYRLNPTGVKPIKKIYCTPNPLDSWMIEKFKLPIEEPMIKGTIRANSHKHADDFLCDHLLVACLGLDRFKTTMLDFVYNFELFNEDELDVVKVLAKKHAIEVIVV